MNNNNIIVPIPADLKAIETALVFGLTKRQLIGFALTGLFSLPIFYLLKNISLDFAGLALVISAMPFMFITFYQDEKLYADKHIKNLLEEKVIYKEMRLYEINKNNREVAIARGFIEE